MPAVVAIEQGGRLGSPRASQAGGEKVNPATLLGGLWDSSTSYLFQRMDSRIRVNSAQDEQGTAQSFRNVLRPDGNESQRFCRRSVPHRSHPVSERAQMVRTELAYRKRGATEAAIPRADVPQSSACRAQVRESSRVGHRYSSVFCHACRHPRRLYEAHRCDDCPREYSPIRTSLETAFLAR